MYGSGGHGLWVGWVGERENTRSRWWRVYFNTRRAVIASALSDVWYDMRVCLRQNGRQLPLAVHVDYECLSTLLLRVVS